MTKHDLKELSAMGAELGAAKAENEKLRGLLERIRTTCCQVRDAQDLDTAPGLSAAESLHEQIEKLDAALSPQAEPTDTFTAVDMATAAAQGFRDGQAAVEPATAQDEQPAVFWVLFDATTPEPYIKKMMPEGFLAFFDHEEDAIRAKSFHPGTDYKRVPYVRQPANLAALYAVTAERDRLLQEKGDPAGSFEKCMQAMRDRDEHARTIDRLRAEVERLRRQLQTAHSFIESTEAFGSAAASGILECAGAVWNIDESKALIAAMAAKEA